MTRSTQMNEKDAVKILGLNGEVTPEIVKRAYHKACSQYHPDRNPAGTEMMKAVNAAYQAIKDITKNIEIDEAAQSYGEDLNEAINAIIHLDLTLEICGAWVWVRGDTKTYKTQLKEAGYKWAPKKKSWYFRPADYKSRSRGKYSMDEIREKFGTDTVARKPQQNIQYA